MEITLKNAFDLHDFPPMPQVSAQERCIAIMIDLIEGGFRYPGITRAHFYDLFVEGRKDTLLEGHVNDFIDELAGDLHDRGCSLAPDELKLALIQIVSAVFLTVLAPGLFEGHQPVDFHDANKRQDYVSRLVTRILT